MLSNRQLVLATLFILATAPAEAVRRLARWVRATRRPISSRRIT